MKKIISIILVLGLVFSLAACGSSSSTGTSSGQSNTPEKTKITVGYISSNKPLSYLDESGNEQGLEVEIMKKVIEQLPDYEVEFVAGDQEAVLLGVDTGKFQVGLGNFFKTAARAEKYVFPEEAVGISLISLIVAKENEGIINTPVDVHDNDLEFVPLPETNANYTMLQYFNQDHPDKAVKIGSAAEWNAAESVKWVAEGRYDVMLGPSSMYPGIIADLGLTDKVVVNDPFAYVNSYALFAKGQEDFAKKYSEVVKSLKEDGSFYDLAVEFYGRDDYHYFDGKEGYEQYRWN